MLPFPFPSSIWFQFLLNCDHTSAVLYFPLSSFILTISSFLSLSLPLPLSSPSLPLSSPPSLLPFPSLSPSSLPPPSLSNSLSVHYLFFQLRALSHVHQAPITVYQADAPPLCISEEEYPKERTLRVS